jgi:hypothetical protein
MRRARMCTRLCVVGASCAGYRMIVQLLHFMNSLSELVIEGTNGVIFQDAAGLADRLEVGSVSAIFPRVSK